MAGEGRFADWTTIFIQENLHQSPVIAAAGVSIFSGCIV